MPSRPGGRVRLARHESGTSPGNRPSSSGITRATEACRSRTCRVPASASGVSPVPPATTRSLPIMEAPWSRHRRSSMVVLPAPGVPSSSTPRSAQHAPAACRVTYPDRWSRFSSTRYARYSSPSAETSPPAARTARQERALSHAAPGGPAVSSWTRDAGPRAPGLPGSRARSYIGGSPLAFRPATPASRGSGVLITTLAGPRVICHHAGALMLPPPSTGLPGSPSAAVR